MAAEVERKNSFPSNEDKSRSSTPLSPKKDEKKAKKPVGPKIYTIRIHSGITLPPLSVASVSPVSIAATTQAGSPSPVQSALSQETKGTSPSPTLSEQPIPSPDEKRISSSLEQDTPGSLLEIKSSRSRSRSYPENLPKAGSETSLPLLLSAGDVKQQHSVLPGPASGREIFSSIPEEDEQHRQLQDPEASPSSSTTTTPRSLSPEEISIDDEKRRERDANLHDKKNRPPSSEAEQSVNSPTEVLDGVGTFFRVVDQKIAVLLSQFLGFDENGPITHEAGMHGPLAAGFVEAAFAALLLGWALNYEKEGHAAYNNNPFLIVEAFKAQFAKLSRSEQANRVAVEKYVKDYVERVKAHLETLSKADSALGNNYSLGFQAEIDRDGRVLFYLSLQEKVSASAYSPVPKSKPKTELPGPTLFVMPDDLFKPTHVLPPAWVLTDKGLYIVSATGSKKEINENDSKKLAQVGKMLGISITDIKNDKRYRQGRPAKLSVTERTNIADIAGKNIEPDEGQPETFYKQYKEWKNSGWRKPILKILEIGYSTLVLGFVFFWLTWICGTLVTGVSTEYIIPGVLWISFAFVLMIPFTAAFYVMGQRFFNWLRNHYGFGNDLHVVNKASEMVEPYSYYYREEKLYYVNAKGDAAEVIISDIAGFKTALKKLQQDAVDSRGAKLKALIWGVVAAENVKDLSLSQKDLKLLITNNGGQVQPGAPTRFEKKWFYWTPIDETEQYVWDFAQGKEVAMKRDENGKIDVPKNCEIRRRKRAWYTAIYTVNGFLRFIFSAIARNPVVLLFVGLGYRLFGTKIERSHILPKEVEEHTLATCRRVRILEQYALPSDDIEARAKDIEEELKSKSLVQRVTPYSKPTPAAIARFFWLTAFGMTVMWEYIAWFLMAAAVYFYTLAGASVPENGKVFTAAVSNSIGIFFLVFGLAYGLWKTWEWYYGIDSDANRLNGVGARNQQARVAAEIEELTFRVSQQQTDIDLFKLDRPDVVAQCPMPNFIDATNVNNLNSLQDPKIKSSALWKFVNHTDVAAFLLILATLRDAVYPARELFIPDTGMATNAIFSFFNKIFAAAGYGDMATFSPFVLVGLLFFYTIIHIALRLSKRQADETRAQIKLRRELGPLQKQCLIRQLAVLQAHHEHLLEEAARLPQPAAVSAGSSEFKPPIQQVVPGAVPSAPDTSELYGDVDSDNSTMRREARHGRAYFLGWLALTIMFALFALSLVPAVFVYSRLLVLSIALPATLIGIFALGRHLFYQYRVLSEQEKQNTWLLILGLAISAVYLINFSFAASSYQIILFLAPVFVTAILFTLNYQKPTRGVAYAKEFLRQWRPELEDILAKDLMTKEDRELLEYACDAVIMAMHPRSGQLVALDQWAAIESQDGEERDPNPLYHFRSLKRIREVLSKETPIKEYRDQLNSTFFPFWEKGALKLSSEPQSVHKVSEATQTKIDYACMMFMMTVSAICLIASALYSIYPVSIFFVTAVPLYMIFKLAFPALGAKLPSPRAFTKVLLDLLFALAMLGALTVACLMPFKVLTVYVTLPVVVGLLLLAQLSHYYLKIVRNLKTADAGAEEAEEKRDLSERILTSPELRQIFLWVDLILVVGAAFSLPIVSSLLLLQVGIFAQTSATVSALVVGCALPAVIFILKVLLPRVIASVMLDSKYYKDHPEEKEEQKTLYETYTKRAAIIYSGLLCIAAWISLAFVPFTMPFAFATTAWFVGLLVGEFGVNRFVAWGVLSGEKETRLNASVAGLSSPGNAVSPGSYHMFESVPNKQPSAPLAAGSVTSTQPTENKGSMRNQEVTIQQTKAMGDTPVFQTRTGLFKPQDKHAHTLKTTLSENYEIGAAYDQGDCFFDSVAQELLAAGVSIPGKPEQNGCKKIRVLCNEYLKRCDGSNLWVKERIEKDAGAGGQAYQTCLATSAFTQPEMAEMLEKEKIFDGLSTWGRPHIEGRILCEELNVKLHVIEMERDSSILPTHQLIDATGSKTVGEEEIDLKDPKLVHIAIYRSHYVPLQPKARPLSNNRSIAAPSIEVKRSAVTTLPEPAQQPVENERTSSALGWNSLQRLSPIKVSRDSSPPMGGNERKSPSPSLRPESARSSNGSNPKSPLSTRSNSNMLLFKHLREHPRPIISTKSESSPGECKNGSPSSEGASLQGPSTTGQSQHV